MTELVYATRRVPEATGRTFINARFYNRPDTSATKVLVSSEFPAIAEAYRAAGVPVVIIGPKSRGDVPEPPGELLRRIRRG